MSEDDLKDLIPKFGDRVAIRNYAMKKNSSQKQSLIEKLREKITKKNATKESNATAKKR